MAPVTSDSAAIHALSIFIGHGAKAHFMYIHNWYSLVQAVASETGGVVTAGV